MSERLPYEESLHRQLADLSTPDEDRSWLEMKKLLDKEDDDRPLVPPFIWGCLGWTLPLLLIGGLLWWIIVRPGKEQKNSHLPTTQQAKPAHPVPAITTGKEKSTDTNNRTGVLPLAKTPGSGRKDTRSRSTALRRTPATIPTDRNRDEGPGRKASRLSTATGSRPAATASSSAASRKKITLKRKGSVQQKPADRTAAVHPVKRGASPQTPAPSGGWKIDSLASATIDTASSPDTASARITIRTDSVKKEVRPGDTAQKAAPKAKDKKKAQYWVSAGIGLQQQIPLDGQKATPYSYYGRKGSLADYIPSVYVRLHRDERWFVQGEFRYGAPQSVREVAYSQQVVTDSAQGTHTVTSLRLKRTFYHQVPLSFNYYVLPHWSVGAGMLYSRFHGAVSEEEVRRLGTATQRDSILLKKIVHIPSSTDSFFTRAQAHLLFQTEYSWRRLALSLRYTRGLQPFIRYVDAGGRLQAQTNQSFDAALRFRIWRSKKK